MVMHVQKVRYIHEDTISITICTIERYPQNVGVESELNHKRKLGDATLRAYLHIYKGNGVS